jgi:hypothetical protein
MKAMTDILYIHQQAVNIVGAKMPETAHRKGTPFPVRNQKKTTIKTGGPDCVKRMKTYAAAPGIKNRISKQMVNINNNRTDHNYSGLLPVFLPE